MQQLPNSITHLQYNQRFTTPITSLPPSLQFLDLGFIYDKPLPLMPTSLTHLTFSVKFCLPVTSLPPQLTHLIFGAYFNHPVDHFLPHLHNLKYLVFGAYFAQTITQFPDQLTHLKMKHTYNQPVFQPPKTLTHLSVGKEFIGTTVTLPENLSYLSLLLCSTKVPFPPKLTHLLLPKQYSCDSLPQTITHLQWSSPWVVLARLMPPNLTHLVFRSFLDDIPEITLPPSLTHVVCHMNTKVTCTRLPPNLVMLDSSSLFFEDKTFPPSLVQLSVYGRGPGSKGPPDSTHLSISSKLMTLDRPFPSTLTHLRIYLNGPQLTSLPSNIIHLTVIVDYTISSVDFLPPHLEYLYLQGHVTTSLDSLPDSLVYLAVHQMKYKITRFPKSLKHFFYSTFIPVPPHIRNYYDSDSGFFPLSFPELDLSM